jgi:hypothetical protein
MPTPHKHAEAIKAWADGYEVQLRNRRTGGKWVSLDGNDAPCWYSENEYRKKPEEVVDYTIVWGDGTTGAQFRSLTTGVDESYGATPRKRQGYMKRTMIGGEVVSLEFVK